MLRNLGKTERTGFVIHLNPNHVKKFLFVLCLFSLLSINGFSLEPGYCIVGPTSVNIGDQDIYSLTPADGISYIWTVVGGEIVNGQGTPSITVNWTASGPHDVQVQVNTINGIVVIDDNTM
jgi:hypothetical protein